MENAANAIPTYLSLNFGLYKEAPRIMASDGSDSDDDSGECDTFCIQILLLSLTAGGVGLNLVGANHLFLLDLHWNPQLERQAQDRIYRVGQTKPVFMYKFMAVDTIEERIKLLQDKKLSMAEAILTGTKQVGQNKLSIDDLKMIFGFSPNMLPSAT